MLQEYPKWMYHREAPAVIVQDPDELAALGPEWAESPADLAVETAPGVVLEATPDSDDEPAVGDVAAAEEAVDPAEEPVVKTKRGRK